MADERVPTFCALCVSRCGATAVLRDGAFVALEPDPAHPTGRALCAKGKAAPEIVAMQSRVLYPLARTRPKGDPDPGWRRISWDEALSVTAERLTSVARVHGPEAVVFTSASPSTSAMSDSIDWLQRLRRAFGSPNQLVSMELCGWGRYLASAYTYGAGVPGTYLPDLERAGCILYWGYNPSVARLAHATATVDALGRGAKLIVVDPRRAGLAHRADHWLRVRPGTDTGLALSLASVLIEHGWFDRDFVMRWTNGPLLVRADTGRLLRERDLAPAGSDTTFVAWDAAAGAPALYDSRRGEYDRDVSRLALDANVTIHTPSGPVDCRTAFAVLAETCRRHEPVQAEAMTGIPAETIVATARTLWESRPVAFYAWSGVEQHADATQIARAIGILYALTGCLDAPGGNVLFSSVPANPVGGEKLLSPAQRAKALGVADRPLGPGRWEFVTSDEIYTAALESRPYPARALVGFGANLLMAHADGRRGREALASLDFAVHVDLAMTPTAELADIVLPAASPFETEALRIGFEVSQDAQSLVQWRRPVVAPRGEARSDVDIIFALAVRLGLGEHFWNGDVDAGRRHQLEPTGLTIEQLRAHPEGVRVPLETRYRKFAEPRDGHPAGFATRTKRVELYSEELLSHGHPPVPVFVEPPMSPRSRPDLRERFPLVLTCAKSTWFCESQHRGVPALRRHARDPLIEIHPDTARTRAIEDGAWVRISTPAGGVKARARFNRDLQPDVVCGQHGWWESCGELGEPAFDPFGEDGANFNLLIQHHPADPVSGSVPMRAYLCEVAPADRA